MWLFTVYLRGEMHERTCNKTNGRTISRVQSERMRFNIYNRERLRKKKCEEDGIHTLAEPCILDNFLRNFSSQRLPVSYRRESTSNKLGSNSSTVENFGRNGGGRKKRRSNNASKRLKYWYEGGPKNKKQRAYICWLCGPDNKTARWCEFCQIFEE